MRQTPLHLEELAGHVIGAAMGGAISAGGAAALITEPGLAPRFAGVGFLACAIGSILGDLLGSLLASSPASVSAGAAGLAALVLSAASAAPMQILVFILLYEKWFDITPLVGGIAGLAGFVAGAGGRLIIFHTGRGSTSEQAG